MVIIFAAVLVAISQLVCLFVATRLTIAYFERKQADLTSAIDGELSRLTKGEPCQSATVLMAVAQSMGREAGKSVRAGMMADLGHASHAVKAAGDEHQLALISEANPLVGQFLGGMGKRGASKMLNNPLIQMLMGHFLGGGGRGNGQSSVSDTAYTGRKHRD